MQSLSSLAALPVPLPQTEAVLLLDADRTLAPQDTGRLAGADLGLNGAIRSLFHDNGYTAEAFQHHAALWSTVPVPAYTAACARAAAQVQLRDLFTPVLRPRHDLTVWVVTAGLPTVWRQVLDTAGFPHVPMLGGMHAQLDLYWVGPDCKARVVRDLQRRGHRVAAVGDSPVDAPMLRTAEVAAFVADHKGSPGLRALLPTLPDVRHLTTDPQRFGGVPTTTLPELLTDLITPKENHHAA